MIRYLVVLCLALWSFALQAQNVKTYIPSNAYLYLPTLKVEQAKFFPELPIPAYMPSLIEHESCISLTSKRCWSPESELKSAREQGVGFGQITRAYNKAGEVRMDALKDIRDRHNVELRELSWLNVKQRPDLQLRAMVLMSKDNYKALFQVKDANARLHMTDAAYNGGLGGLKKERTACGLAKGCDPQYWFGHVERYCLKSKEAIYGNRSPCDINRHHVDDVFNTRLAKYAALYKQ